MGRTPKPLRILVHPSLMPWPEMDALKEQGHEVVVGGGELTSFWVGFDPIFAPTAWLMTENHKKYLDVALKEARKRKYPPKPKKKGKKK